MVLEEVWSMVFPESSCSICLHITLHIFSYNQLILYANAAWSHWALTLSKGASCEIFLSLKTVKILSQKIVMTVLGYSVPQTSKVFSRCEFHAQGSVQEGLHLLVRVLMSHALDTIIYQIRHRIRLRSWCPLWGRDSAAYTVINIKLDFR